ncbi:MAG TPA: HAMP domain-containing histidine kinase, partial [Clostridiales bacterium]|nr:HAMP domain-containing histidine kinase [Clostridiales bacterium]
GAARQLSQGDYAARAQVVHPGDEVGSVALAFNHMADAVEEHVARLERQDTQQKQFIADMAHELKTPMTGIIGYADLLRRSHVDERQRQIALGAIVAQGERLERMAFKLLAIAGLDGGRAPDMQPASVQAMFDQARDVARHLSDAAGVAIRGDIHMDTLLCDSDLITSLIENLLTNAVKASPPGSEVVFEARDNALRVMDHGTGIPKEHLPYITDAFYMADVSRARAQQGAGLGLALCRRIAALHQAELIIDSEEGKGTEVTVLFTGRIQVSDKPETPASYPDHDRTK